MITVLSGGRRRSAGVVVWGGSRSVTLVPLSVVARTCPSHTPGCMAGWGGEGVADKGVGGGSTQVSVTHSQQLRLETQFWCSALLCFALVLWFAPTISSYDEIAG